MQDFLLILIMVAAFIFGWFLMKRVGIFFEEWQRAQTGQHETEGMFLRIGFTDPFVADSISGALEQYSRQYPGSSLCLFQGDPEVLLKKVAFHKLDIAVLPEQADIPPDRKYKRKKVVMKYGGLPIEPITDKNTTQTLVWLDDGEISAAAHLVKCIENETSYV